MSISFDMGRDTLHTLTQQTGGSVDELVATVRRLSNCDHALQAKFNGSGAISYVNFKHKVDQCANDLTAALNAINIGQSGMDRAAQTGDADMADISTSADGSANYSSARFQNSH